MHAQAHVRRQTDSDRRWRPKTTNFPFSSRGATGDASCYATITNDGDVVHHHQAHVRTYDCHGDAGETLNNFRTQPGAEIDEATGAAAVNETRAPAYCATWVSF